MADEEEMDHATAVAVFEKYVPGKVRLRGTRARNCGIHDLMGMYKLLNRDFINGRPVWGFVGDYSDYVGDDPVLLYYNGMGWVVGIEKLMPNYWIIGTPRDFSEEAKLNPLNCDFEVWDYRVPEGLPDPEDSADEMAQADLAENVWWSDSTLTCTRA
mmetsp:Transcript_20018/g.69400  ORF Transcript_20018/g.69400 Transcript_20018/m.69400 type:complete len:157 (-) Transcript_20018:117-587(-)